MNRLLAQHATPHRHRGVEGQKVKVKAKEAGGASRQHLSSPKLKAVLSMFWAIFHAGNSHFRAHRGGAALCEQPGVRGVARGGARVQRWLCLCRDRSRLPSVLRAR